MSALLLRDVEVNGQGQLDVRLNNGRIAEIGHKLQSPGEAIDGRGGALIPGLVDNHIHLFALAAHASSADVAEVTSRDEFAARIRQATSAIVPGGWLRVTGYHESCVGALTRDALDIIAPRHRVRVQHQTGALWVLNSLALESLGDDLPEAVERDAKSVPTGLIWRGDAWLRARIGDDLPQLARIGRQLAAYGLTALTDASATTDEVAASRLAEAVRNGELPQRLTLMSGSALSAPSDGAFTVGPLKILLDEHELPDFCEVTSVIQQVHACGRSVAVHSVTPTTLAFTLAAFGAAGARRGDRIEHGSVISDEAIGEIRTLGLAVVTQPAFVRERGDRYLRQVPLEEQPDLYRCRSLLRAGVRVAASSDAPYGCPDPWVGMDAAVTRLTRSEVALGTGERVPPMRALELYLGDPFSADTRPQCVRQGMRADLCLLQVPLREALRARKSSVVRATLIAGHVVHSDGTVNP